MIIGSSPIILLIFPTCAAGAFMLKASEVRHERAQMLVLIG
jgi:hypothetical protein